MEKVKASPLSLVGRWRPAIIPFREPTPVAFPSTFHFLDELPVGLKDGSCGCLAKHFARASPLVFLRSASSRRFRWIFI